MKDPMHSENLVQRLLVLSKKLEDEGLYVSAAAAWDAAKELGQLAQERDAWREAHRNIDHKLDAAIAKAEGE